MPPARRRSTAARRDLVASLRFLALILLLALAIRGFVAAPFMIPSESMLPRLLAGDLVLVAKWPYGWSRYSLPGALPLWSGRIFAAAPARGEVVVFRNPADPRANYIKRVIGLPGDRVAVRDGRLVLNGTPVPRLRIADFHDPVTPNSPCRTAPGLTPAQEPVAEGGDTCRYRRYRETLADGTSWTVLDQGTVPAADDVATQTVPAGHYFLLGDNRDRSADSRFPAGPTGIGMVPAENLVGRALVTFWSHDGSARLSDPASWLAAVRWDRIGLRIHAA